ncbi:MAG: hypothetical protein MUP11_05420 [Anaerolineales bacterium]|nr:hypothetical protein [Anaerolineales bacterium]
MNKYYRDVVRRFSEKENRIFAFFGLLILLLFISLQISLVRSLIIDIAEFFLNRTISYEIWNSKLIRYSLYLIIPIILCLLIAVFDVYNQYPKILSTWEGFLNNHKWIRTASIILIWLTIIVLFSLNNITNPDFWFDESGQFWVAKGLNHVSEPYSQVGTIGDLIQNNRVYNLDPGGFTLLLRYWTMIANSPIFLRLLPLMFFSLSMILVSRLCLIWYPNHPFSFFAGFILLFSSLLKYYAFELRPYSMEMFTALASLFLCHKIPKILSSGKTAIFAGLAMALLLTSRYPAFLTIGVLGCFTFYELISKEITKQSIINFTIFITPIVISAAAIYFFTFQFQFPRANPPSYVDDFMLLTGNSWDILFNLETIKVYAPFLILLSLFIFKFKNVPINQFKKYFSFTIILNILFAILSLTGKHPWSFITKWDISIHVIMLLSLLPFIFFGLNQFEKIFNVKRMTNLFFNITFIFISAIIATNYTYSGFGSIYDNFTECQVVKNENVTILATNYASPTIRYFFEFGPLNKYDQIYQNINFSGNSGGPEYINDFDYIILPHWYDISYEIIQEMNLNDNWKECSKNKYSKMYINTNIH